MDKDSETFSVTGEHLNFYNNIKYKLEDGGEKNSIQLYNL
jgi:hypothetical protein